jgi:phosphoribosylanthranilate isomerase
MTEVTHAADGSEHFFPHASNARTRIKLCGLRTKADVQAAVEAGADAVGFVFYPPSPRAVTVEQAAQLAKTLPPWVTAVGLFVNPDVAQVQAALSAIPGLMLQFHADEDDAFCSQFSAPYIKVARMHAGLNLVEFSLSYPGAQAILVDALVQGYGGAGHSFDWSWLPKAENGSLQLDKPLILSGGLTVDNVADAVKTVRPYAVDVSSGIERSRGEKCPQRMAAFCRAVRAADAGSEVS